MSDVDDQIARARASMERIAGDYGQQVRVHRKRIARKATGVGRRLALIAAADAAILIAAAILGGVIGGLGVLGFLAVMMLLVAVTLAIALAPAARPPTEEKLRQTDLKTLPAQTERWLEAQRPALPAPAVRLVDSISQRLEQLSPQLARVDDETDAAYEVRKLVGEQLPAFIKDYERVPANLRTVERNGRTPDAELVDGLKLIERGIGDMTERLAAADLDQLQTRGRYLEMKYRDDAGHS
ncbi:MAG: hypothetical protein JWN21_200 [Sphingomonas bacterium]|uniref:hypothetical protein n=1 Tax=Sphingomonas bacterium TaxID=1895847 RepID=UPI0026137C53|nr:hypothetical protein [Sphingomonas bacterium]MDB5694657.1 hypothetical protein [Sphingomonas bacterium]